jgi:hypothetical protein
MRYRVLPYKQDSKSAKALAEALGGKVLKLEGSTFKPREEDTVINWGNSNGFVDEEGDDWSCFVGFKYYNDGAAIADAANKLFFFRDMKDTGLCPPFWTDKQEITDEDYPIVCRTVLSGHSGAGIHIANCSSELVDAPLYVKYIKKKEEYRIHVGRTSEGNTVTIAAQRKARRLSTPGEEVNWQVRNLAGGFVFVREGFSVPSAVEEAAHHCLRETALDFGAVDVIWNEHTEKAYVLEINTAPGLEGQTIQDYAEFFRGNS